MEKHSRSLLQDTLGRRAASQINRLQCSGVALGMVPGAREQQRNKRH